MKFKLIVLLLFASQIAAAQDSVFARKIIDTLTSPYFWGRGYTHNGMAKAAAFLTGQFRDYGLTPMNGDSYMQQFGYPVNTFPGPMEVSINNVLLIPGKDYIIAPESRGVTAEGQLIQKDSTHFINQQHHILVTLEDKLTWSAEQKAANYTLIQLDKKSQKIPPQSFRIHIESVFDPDFKAGNIGGIVKGTLHPDSVIVYTAHYDHLGGMGSKVYFPGANDNASGVAQVLSLAKYYAAHPQPYSMAFILFAGEEAGLLGSRYFSEHPLIPLKNIRFLVNLDLEGTGIDGITIVNATVYPQEFAELQQTNQLNKYLPKINPRGKAANSDHYFFTEKGVPAFYMYTLGGIKAYHDIYDISATLPLTAYNSLFKLLLKFNEGLMGRRFN
jgi:hypothetical protein